MARLGDVVTSLLRKRAYTRPMQVGVLREAWKRVAGEELSSRSRVASYRDGTLTMEVGSAALRYELEAFRGTELLTALGQVEHLPRVDRIVFRVGSMPS